jgi:hypothetical protein
MPEKVATVNLGNFVHFLTHNYRLSVVIVIYAFSFLGERTTLKNVQRTIREGKVVKCEQEGWPEKIRNNKMAPCWLGQTCIQHSSYMEKISSSAYFFCSQKLIILR